MVGQTGDDVNEYDLSSAWNISTAVYLQTFSVTAQDTIPISVFFKPDGTKMYVLGYLTKAVWSYDVNAWDISTAVYNGTPINSFPVTAQDTNPTDVFFKPDGTKMYVIGTSSDSVNEYNLSVAWDVTTAVFLQNFSVAKQDVAPTGLFFKSDGTKMYVIGPTKAVYEYDLSSAWNISTASFTYPVARITRLNADGTLDPAFYTNTGMFDNLIYAIALQPDGKILVGGQFTQFDGVTRNRLVRLNADGTEDTAFNNNLGTGFYYSTIYNPGRVRTIYVQPDGKILVGGYFQYVNGNYKRMLARLNADGTVDSTFGPNLTSLNSTVMTVAVQSDGLIVIGGFFSAVHSGASGQGRYGIAWLDSSGEQQSTPYLAIANRVMTYVYVISAQPDGKILMGGSFTEISSSLPRNRLVRFNADSTEDTAFYTNLGTAFNNIVEAIAVQADGKILVCGQFTTFNGNTRNYLVRLNADGTEDTGFTVGTGFNNIVQAIAVQSDGKILVGGNFTSYDGETQNRITRLNADGTGT